MKALAMLKEKIKTEMIRKRLYKKTPTEKAIEWIKMYRMAAKGRVIPHYKQNVVPLTQETTGYLIPTLYNFGEKGLAQDLVRWEASVQRQDGAFSAKDNVPYTFDTAQVVRGFLAVLDDMPEIEENLIRACDYVEGQIDGRGKIHTQSYHMWRLPDGSILHDYGNLYVLPPLLQAGEKLSEPRYTQAARRGMDYYRQKPDLVEFKSELVMLSHYFGYMMEALVELGEIELARKGLNQAAAIQKENGAIPAYPGVDWVCSTGMAQLALAWYKLGEIYPANKALEYLEKIQNPCGGFYGSYGKDAGYFPTKEISWAVKFFLDANYWKAKMPSNKEVNIYSTSIKV